MSSHRYELDLTLKSAKSLKNVNWRHGPNQPYAVVWVDQANKFTTNVDPNGDTEADWNQPLTIPLPPIPFEDINLYLDVVHAGFEEGTKKLIGSARLQLVDVLDFGIGERESRKLTLKRPSGRPQGKVEVKVGIRENANHAQGAYYPPAYGVPYGAPAPAAAPPQQQGSYYSAAPPAGYPQTAPYSSQTNVYVQVEEKKKSKFGGMATGLAVGAVAGVLGGVALAEGAEYIAEKLSDDDGF
ncbi:uncharacterized protein LOC131622990 [Vicia villosa]|uniref:uncharacterized protein LOC131622990 n=1 Tax=Vicia villosa TaxID=3911 RepID=UPI00273CD1F4|nr:uncharacterized protein LOC131622990 [Vicia villosa]